MGKQDITTLSQEELAQAVKAMGVPAFRASQITGWLRRGVSSFDEMTNLPAAMRSALSQQYVIPSVCIEKKLVSKLDGTVKYLFRLSDGELIEAVLMQYQHGTSMCISTQAGCKMGCAFCATGMGGYRRNLTAYEMTGQILAAQKDENRRVSNVVLMGMGEPLDNYENVLSFLRMVSDPEGLNIGMRHISLSTCGVVDKIYDLMEHRFQLTLSVSLHAPNDEIRGKIMPINKKWGIDALLTACRDYAAATKRRISFEYAMIDGVNDSDACARELAQRLRGMLCHVNLIPANDVSGKPFQKSGRERLLRFSEILTKKGITTTVRRSLGADIEAACGQLRGKHKTVTS